MELLPCEDPTAPVLGSKASGEPVSRWHSLAFATSEAQLLGGAFFFAVKDAIGASTTGKLASKEL